MVQSLSYDVVVIGSGVGGGVVARNLAENGVSVLLLERGETLPREPENWQVNAVFHDKRYTARDIWYDKDGAPFRPAIYYNVGGSSKFYGASMVRLRERDFEAVEHESGISPAWPIRYRELAPFYDRAERMFGVRGALGTDPTEPPHATDFPYQPIGHEPAIADMVRRIEKQGLRPFPLPQSILRPPQGGCIRCGTCDGFPCKVDGKGDAEICAVLPAIRTGRVNMVTRACARRLVLSPDGKRVETVEYERDGRVEHASGAIFVVACSAVNSAALLLRSGNAAAPLGAANSSGMVGRHYMAHNNTALMAVSTRLNPTVFQKTVAVNDFYFGDPDYKYPMGNAQLLGKLRAGMLTAGNKLIPQWLSAALSDRSVDWWVMSEDLPDPENRVMVDDERITLAYTPNNRKAHYQLVRRISRMMRRAGYPLILTKTVGTVSTSHQCGTVRFGNDPAEAPLDTFCRSFDHSNLFVVDASFFPSSSAMNPALTIAAQALRASDHMLARDFGVSISAIRESA
jgi:choline dehydrogenase-like flavoprotein